MPRTASMPFWAAFLTLLLAETFRVSLAFVASSSSSSSSTTTASSVRGRSAVSLSRASSSSSVVDMADVGFVVLAGGKGSRMRANMPKQFLELCGAPILHHSLDLFLERLPAYLRENGASASQFVILVLDPVYHEEYRPIADKYRGRLHLAEPGVERQGSVRSGLETLAAVSQGACQYAAIHDSARPLVTIDEVCRVVQDAKQYGAAVLGVPCKATIKESDDGILVRRTVPRARLWEVHTPQVVRIETLRRGFDKVEAERLEVTDDVSIVEALGEPVKLTTGEYTNLKITTPEDMDVAKAILSERNAPTVNLMMAVKEPETV